MNLKEVKSRIDKLKKLINHHRHLYHVLDKQEISDAALDSLKKELFDLEQKYPQFITEDSPTQRVGGKPAKEFKKVRHKEKMLSLNDVFSKEDFYEWVKRISKLLSENERKRIDFYCELKIDGLAIELEYEKGILRVGSTRGDGLIGEDITQNLKTIEAIPLSLLTTNIKLPANLIVRGEVFISKKEFEKVNKLQKDKGLPLYANPRNIAAGSLRQLDSKITASRNLDSFAYDIVNYNEMKWLGAKGAAIPAAKSGLGTHEERHRVLKELGFKTNKNNQYCKSAEEVFAFFEKCSKTREKLPYEIDGVVVIVNNNQIFEKLGVVGKAPRGAVAFKFAQSQATTVVEDIKIQVGRTGAITPVAVLKPVKVSGITITRATLHNEDEIKRLGIKIGDTVIVGRAGDVIPDIVKVLPELRTGKEKNFIMPKICPSCKTKLEKTGGEALLRCPNPKCFARRRRNFYHFVSRPAFNIDGLGPKIIDRLLDFGLVTDPSDLFSLEVGDIIQLEKDLPRSKSKALLPGFGEKSAENLIKSISEKKEIILPRFIYSLGIRNVGEETAIDLARRFNSIENLKKTSLEELQSISNIGPIVARSVYEWFLDKDNLKFLEKLLKSGIKIKAQGREIRGKLSGKTFVFTGILDSISRELAKEKVRKLGGEISESVSKKTDFVVAGEDSGSKLEKAKSFGVKIIDEKEFIKMIE